MKHISAEKFVKTWQTCSTVDEVATVLNLKRASCILRAVAFRKKGIPLKYYTRKTRLDIGALVILAKENAQK